MKNKNLYHHQSRFPKIRPWYFFVASAISLFIAVPALQANNLRMGELRAAVFEADEKNGDVSKALTELRDYVTTHMNTNLSAGSNAVYPPIQLKYTYERLREANIKQTNERLYTDAQIFCEQQKPNDFSGRSRVPCIEQYVENGGAAQRAVPENLYKFDFVSPLWSPDLAGFSVLTTVLFLLLGILTWAFQFWLKRRA